MIYGSLFYLAESRDTNVTRQYPWGDTAVSLQTLGGGFLATQNSKSQVLTKFHYPGGGGGVFWTHSSNTYVGHSKEFSIKTN